jgi:hypothetical protein
MGQIVHSLEYLPSLPLQVAHLKQEEGVTEYTVPSGPQPAGSAPETGGGVREYTAWSTFRPAPAGSAPETGVGVRQYTA